MASIGPDASLLQLLLDKRPSPLRRTTLLDALEMGRREVPQSLLLAWLLAPQGPLTDHWLLRRLLRRVAASLPWPGTPRSVLPEVAIDAERPDIVAEWESFKLIVEYKIDSPEGVDQLGRYLKTFGVATEGDGLAIYLTPNGRWPASVRRGDPRVRCVSFAQLIGIIAAGLNDGDEPSERGRAMAAEYRDCLIRILHRSLTVDAPVVSDATKLLSQHHEHYDRLLAVAHQETAEFIQHLASRAEAELRGLLGSDMVVSVRDDWGYFVFRKPSWSTSEIEYGIALGCEGKLGAKQMHEYAFNVSVRVQPLDRGTRVHTHKSFTGELRAAIESDVPADDDGWNRSFAYQEDATFDPNASWDAWADDVVARLRQAAVALTPALDRFAAARRSPTGEH